MTPDEPRRKGRNPGQISGGGRTRDPDPETPRERIAHDAQAERMDYEGGAQNVHPRDEPSKEEPKLDEHHRRVIDKHDPKPL